MTKFKYTFLLALLSLCLCGCGRAPAPTVPETVPTETVPAMAVVPAEATPPTETFTSPTEPEPERFLLTFVGDCTLGSNPVNAYAGFGFIKTVGEDYGYPFRNVIDYLTDDECTFANLEGPLTDEGYPVQKTHTFRGPEAFVNILTQNSVEFVSLANNHTLDYGQVGCDNTRKVLDGAKISYVQRDTARIFTTPNGLTIGVYGAVYYKLDKADMARQLAALDTQCDLVIYAPHWGTERIYQPTAEQLEVGRFAIDAGADIVWGSHPHVLQPMEAYGDGYIFYSLGNFSFGGNGMPDDFDTALIQAEVIREPDGTVRLGETSIVPCCVSSISERNNFQPTPYAPDSEGYRRVMEKLDGKDLPAA